MILILAALVAIVPSFAAEHPCLKSDFTRVFVPKNGRYLNDHTLVRSREGVWHLYGITSRSKGDAWDEKTFLHATASRLAGPWTEHEDALVADPEALNERVAWAPHVAEWSPGKWLMFYWAEWVHPDSLNDFGVPRGLRRADSTDLEHWTKLETRSDASLRPKGGRDPFLMHFNGEWLLYSVWSTANDRGQIVISTNSDVNDPKMWSWVEPVIEDPTPAFGWGNLESPYVVERDGDFFLFLTRTGPMEPAEYSREMVFRSKDPKHFEWKPVSMFFAHASEVVREGSQDYLTSAGYTGVIGEENRGLKIAPLDWCRD